jgi:hypothetical protein
MSDILMFYDIYVDVIHSSNDVEIFKKKLLHDVFCYCLMLLNI